MPWIACGYGLLMVSRVFQRVCFSTGHTARGLAIEAIAAGIGLVATTVGILGWGLVGAAIAVPVCFAFQLTLAVVIANTVQYTPVHHSLAEEPN